MEPAAGRAHFRQDVQDGMNVAPHQPGHGPNAAPFSQQLDDLDRLVVFDPDAFQWLRFAECFSATHAAITLYDAVDVPEKAKSFGFSVAAMACHLTFPGQDIK